MTEQIDIGGGRIIWRKKELLADVEKKFSDRLAIAAEMVKTQVQKNISVSTREAGPSEPGDYPHADTGRLRNSIFWTFVGKMAVIVGTPLEYGLKLEYSGRSFLRRTLNEMASKVARVLGKAA